MQYGGLTFFGRAEQIIGVNNLDDKELDELLAQIRAVCEDPEEQENIPEPAQEPALEEKAPQPKKADWQKQILMYLHDLVYLLAGVILVLLMCFRVVVVSGTSMNTTLLDGDYLLLLGNVFYQEPKYGDVIVASKESFDDGAPIVKRVIATEGQWVDIDFALGIVSVSNDGMQTWLRLDEPYTSTATNIQEGISFPLYVEEGCLFVMGDNRNGSKDSRSPQIGLIDKREVLGKVVFLFLPGTNYGQYGRDFSRIGVVN